MHYLQEQLLMARISIIPNLGLRQRTAIFRMGLKAGDKAPDFTGYDQTGKQVELKKLLGKGTNNPFLLQRKLVSGM